MKIIFFKKFDFYLKIFVLFSLSILTYFLSYNNLYAQWAPQENLSKNDSVNIISNNSFFIISDNKNNYFDIPINETLPNNQFLFFKGYNEISSLKSENIEFFFLQPVDDIDFSQKNATFINRLNISPYSVCDKDFSVHMNIFNNNSDILNEINVTSSILYFGIFDLNYQINIDLNEKILTEYFDLVSDNTDGQVIIKGCLDKTFSFSFSNKNLLSSIGFLDNIPSNIYFSSLIDKDKKLDNYKYNFCQSKSGFVYPFGSGIAISDLNINKCNPDLKQIQISDNTYKEIIKKQKREFNICPSFETDKCIYSYSTNDDFTYYGEAIEGIPNGIGMWYYQGNLRSAGEIVSNKFNGTAASFNVNDKTKFTFGEYSNNTNVKATLLSKFPYIEEWEKILWASKTSVTPLSDIYENIDYQWFTKNKSSNYISQFFNLDFGIIENKNLNINTENFIDIYQNLLSDNSINGKPILRFNFNNISKNTSKNCYKDFKFLMNQGDYKYDLTDYIFFMGFTEKDILNINILPPPNFFYYFTNKLFSRGDNINIKISLCKNLNYEVSSKNLINSLIDLSKNLKGINKYSEIFKPNEEIYEYFIKQDDLSFEMFNIIDGNEKPNFDLITKNMVYINDNNEGLKISNKKKQRLNFDFIGEDKILSLSIEADELKKLNCSGFDNENVFVKFYDPASNVLMQYNMYIPIKKTASNKLAFEKPIYFLQDLYYRFGEGKAKVRYVEFFASCKNNSSENLLVENRPMKFSFNVDGWADQIYENASIDKSNFFYAIDIKRHNQDSNVSPRNDEAIGRALYQLYDDLGIY